MNWEAVSAVAEGVGAVAVIVTLAYLALQVRYLKQQSVLASFQHTYNALNDFDNTISQSAELASILIRGQRSLDALNPEERFRFDHTIGRLLNIVESWLFQVTETSSSGPYRDEQLRNIREIIRARCNNPGVLQFWAQFKQCYNSDMHTLIRESTDGSAPEKIKP